MAVPTPTPTPPILCIGDMSTSFSEILQAHAHSLKTGLFRSTYAAAHLLHSAVAVSSPLSYTRSLFAHIPSPNSFAWNTIIRAHTAADEPDVALLLFVEMLHSPVLPDRFTYPFVLKACAFLHALQEALQIHGRILKSGFGSDIYVQNTLIHNYASQGLFEDALELFERIPESDVISWNAIISAYVAKGLAGEARELFDRMPERDVETWNFMISGYANLGLIDQAHNLFDRMPIRDVVSWNAMITGCANAASFSDALELFQHMLCENVQPDECTLASVLSVCASVGALRQGEWIHAYIDKNGMEIKGSLATALVDMYSKCGSIEKAKQVFRHTLEKDVSTWNALIEGLSSHGFGEEALLLFEEMREHEFMPNEVTFVNVLSACSHGGFVDKGRWVFDQMVHVFKIEPNVKHYGCIVDLHCRAGFLEEAKELIEMAPIEESAVYWESLLSASRNHGNVEFAEMVAKRLRGLSPQESSSYVQLSNIYASVGRWSDVRKVRGMMKMHGIRKKPGCSTIEVDGVVHEFFSGD